MKNKKETLEDKIVHAENPQKTKWNTMKEKKKNKQTPGTSVEKNKKLKWKTRSRTTRKLLKKQEN
jgi:hypothetical protein